MSALGILVAVGGTGAKVAEAIIHATAAGLGPRELVVAFIDQDDANGNTARARRTVQEYAAARADWRRAGSAHRLGNDSGLLRPNIRLLLPEAPLWVPHPDAAATLDRVVGKLDDIDRALMDILFAKGHEEQEMPLGNGYQGRPNVGATAIALASEGAEAANFFRALTTEMNRAREGGTRVRLLVAGSLFGGTGAGGFPTLARLLKLKAPEMAGDSFGMAGTLMLPYFSFPPPDTEDGPRGNYARADQFLVQSRAALLYYHRLKTEGQLPFQRMILTGWDQLFRVVGRFNPGGSGQENDAMPPELLAGLASCGFLNGEAPLPDEGTIEAGTREHARRLLWTDCPTEGEDQLRPYRRLGHAIRFAIGWDYYSRHISAEGNKPNRLVFFQPGHPAFFSKQGLHKLDWRKSPPVSEMQSLSVNGANLLGWAKQIERTAREWGEFGLWSLGDWEPELAEQRFGDVYKAAITAPVGAAKPTTAQDLKRELDNVPGDQTAAGLGVMVERLHSATALH